MPWVLSRSPESAVAQERHGHGHDLDWTPRLTNRCHPARDPRTTLVRQNVALTVLSGTRRGNRVASTVPPQPSQD